MDKMKPKPKKVKRDISEHPAMIRLNELFSGMSEEEQDRTKDYLEGEGYRCPVCKAVEHTKASEGAKCFFCGKGKMVKES